LSFDGDSTKVLNAHILNLYHELNSGGVDNIPYNRKMSVILKPGDLIRPEPFKAFGGYFRVLRNRKASLLPLKTENIATRFSTSLQAANIAGTAVPLPKVSTAFNVNQGELAHWKLLCLTGGYDLQVGQPNENKLFADQEVRFLNYANTTANYKSGNYSQIPEIFSFEDRTPIKFIASSTDPDRVNFNVIVGAYGFKYFVDVVQIQNYEEPDVIHPETKIIIDMGDPQRG
jgi:hypothetical protein